MLDQLFNMIQTQGQDSVINNPAVPNEHNAAVLQEAGNSIVGTIKNLMAEGKMGDIMNLANHPDSPLSQGMQNNFAENIMQKFGINGDAAKNIAGSLIPGVIAKIKDFQAGDGQTGGFDLSAISAMLGKTGLDKDGDGDVDLKDVTKMFGF